MDFARYVEEWRNFAKQLEQTGQFEVATEIVRPYSAAEVSEFEADLAQRFGAEGFRIEATLRGLLMASLSVRVQWKSSASTTAGSLRLTPQDVFETDAESGTEHVDFWKSERVLEPVSETEDVVVLFAASDAEPKLFLRDENERLPLPLTIAQYLEQAWNFKGLYGWQRALASGGDTAALKRKLAQVIPSAS